MMRGLTCEFLRVLYSPGAKVWLFARGTGYFPSWELNPLLHLVLSQQGCKWGFPCKAVGLQDDAGAGSGEMKPFR